MRSAIFRRMSARSAGLVFFHAGNAFQPALTALSTSAFDASAQTPMILPVAGVVTSYDFSPSAAIHSPSMKSPQQAR